MAAGSPEPESDSDQQCRHCGCWYASAGLLPHEQNCDYRESTHRLHDLVDLFAIRRADDVDVEATVDRDPTEESGESAPITADPGPEPEGGPAPEATPARTDGGDPAPVPDDFERADVEEAAAADLDTEPDDQDSCPTCGSTVSIPVEELPDKVLDAVPDLREFSELCRPCSVTDGKLDQQVEAY